MNVLQLFLSPRGRVRRRTYWLNMFLPLFVISWSLAFIEAHAKLGGLLLGCWYLLVIWPVIAITIKRWHDRDKAGWWLLIVLIPFLGWAWNLIECGILSGTGGANRFGPDPRGRTEQGALNGDPATPPGTSGVGGGPPSVS
jgi:uncharacterized membrane protein YhaH (DUF805 family)